MWVLVLVVLVAVALAVVLVLRDRRRGDVGARGGRFSRDAGVSGLPFEGDGGTFARGHHPSGASHGAFEPPASPDS